jgi:colanic acid/amylovoran biosynthesis glycosyltransferase
MKAIGCVVADFPVFSETFVGNEIRAMQRRGHHVVPIVMHLRSGPAQTADKTMAETAPVLQSVTAASAIVRLICPSRSARAALAFAFRQTRLPAPSLIWNGIKIAHRACSRTVQFFSLETQPRSLPALAEAM